MSSRLMVAISATALVVAVLGSTPLGHALASQVPRNSVGPLQLKRNAVGPAKVAPNAIRSSHVLDGSLLTADFKPGQIPQGPKGDRGEKGERGEQGPPGLSAREVVSASTAVDSTDFKTITATCPAGKTAIGGGAGVDFFVVAAVTSSSPTGTNAWRASAIEFTPSASTWRLTASVVCALVAA
jgi:hypothetical protein